MGQDINQKTIERDREGVSYCEKVTPAFQEVMLSVTESLFPVLLTANPKTEETLANFPRLSPVQFS